MVNPDTWAARVARAKALCVLAREIRAAARNQRHVAVLRRALDRRMRPASSARYQAKPD